MKLLIVIFLFPLTILAQLKSDKILPSNYYNGLKQVVKESHLTSNGKLEEHGTKKGLEIYNYKGQLIEVRKYKGGIIALYRLFEYNQNNQILKETILTPNKKLFRTIEYAYQDSVLTEKKVKSSQGNILFVNEYKYNPQGDLVYKNEKNNLTYYKYTYSDNIIKKEVFNDKRVRLETYYYVDSANVKMTYLGKHNPKSIIKKEVFNDRGLITKKSLFNKGKGITTHTYVYNKNGVIVLEEVADLQQETEYTIFYNINRKGRLKEKVCKYKYDDEIEYKYKFRYNLKGKERKFIRYENNLEDKRIEKYKYDRQLYLTSIRFYKGRKLSRTIKYTNIYF